MKDHETMPSIDTSATPDITIDPRGVRNTLKTLGVNDEGIESLRIVTDNKTHIIKRGETSTRGDITLSTKMSRLGELSSDTMSRTLRHELKHVAQIDQRDPKLVIGWAGIVASMAAGVYLGSKLPERSSSKAAGAIAGASLGYFTGYFLAPHEHDARKFAHSNDELIVKRRSDKADTHDS